MPEMDNISKKPKTVARKKITNQTQDDLGKEAKQIGDAVDKFEKDVEEEAPVTETSERFSAAPEKSDPEPIFPGSAKKAAIPASLRPAVPAKPKVYEAAEVLPDKRWKYFGIGFGLGAVVLGGLIAFLLISAYGTTNANLKAKNTQLQSQLESAQKINSENNSSSSSENSLLSQ
jgi:F0F1-type ATP synthase membrane subunit b/b'